MTTVTNIADDSAWRAARVKQGLSRRQAAKLACIDAAQLSRVERGQSHLSVASMLRLAGVLPLRGLVRELTRVCAESEGPGKSGAQRP